MKLSGLGQGQVAGCCECGNETSCSIKCGEFPEQLRICQLLRKDSVPWSSLVIAFPTKLLYAFLVTICQILAQPIFVCQITLNFLFAAHLKYSVSVQRNMQDWWEDFEGNTEVSETKLPQLQVVRHKSHMNYFVIQPALPRTSDHPLPRIFNQTTTLQKQILPPNLLLCSRNGIQPTGPTAFTSRLLSHTNPPRRHHLRLSVLHVPHRSRKWVSSAATSRVVVPNMQLVAKQLPNV